MKPTLSKTFSLYANDNSPASDVIRIVTQHPETVAAFGSDDALNRVLEGIVARDKAFEQAGGRYFQLGASPAETATNFTQTHIEQYRDAARPSLPALAAHHLQEFGVSPDSPHYKAAMLVAARAELTQDFTPEYHNQHHYEDVTAQVAEFLKRNNRLADAGVPGATKLTPEEMADSITAALGHDIDHPGGKNALPGEKAPADIYRLERQSFAAMEPLLRQAGLKDNEIADIHTMILTTSPDGPHSVLKAVAKAQQEGRKLEWSDVDPNGKYPELRNLLDDPKLTQRAAILEDADLGASAFEGIASNIKMSAVFTDELQNRNYVVLNGPKAGQLEDLRGAFARAMFGKFVVGEGPASVAAQDAVGQNYTDMRAVTERELAAPAPAP